MLLDMSQILSGAVNTLSFSYPLSAARIPYSREAAAALLNGAEEAARDTIISGTSEDDTENGDVMPLIFDDVTVLSPVIVTGNVVNRAGYMVLTETAEISYRTRCARCLADVEEHTVFRVEKTVADEKGLLRLENRENDDYVQINGGKLDLDAPICDEILLSFPMRTFCREDCQGLCPGCGVNLNTEKCICTKKNIDPRFASLAALLDTMPDDDENEAEAATDGGGENS